MSWTTIGRSLVPNNQYLDINIEGKVIEVVRIGKAYTDVIFFKGAIHAMNVEHGSYWVSCRNPVQETELRRPRVPRGRPFMSMFRLVPC